MGPDKQTLDALRIDHGSAPRGGPSVSLVVSALAVVAMAAGLVWWFNRPQPAAVRTMLVEAKAAGGPRTLLNGAGYVKARREATISSKVTGKVLDVLVEEGMTVKPNQELARLDSTNLQKSLHLAQAHIDGAREAIIETRASLEQSERELKRISSLSEKGAATTLQLDRAETEVRVFKARLARQSAELTVSEREAAVWEQQIEDMVIRAPFGGVVISKNAQPGEMISPMSSGGFTRTGICTIVDMSTLEIEVDVNEAYINRVEPGLPVLATLDSYPDWKIPAKVIAIIPTADRGKATVKVRVGFEKIDPRFFPDMSVKVAFQGAAEATPAAAGPTITIPKAALRQRDGRDIVWLVRDGKAERRAVTVEPGAGDDLVVTAGITGGERVVIEGAENLVEGAGVTESKR